MASIDALWGMFLCFYYLITDTNLSIILYCIKPKTRVSFSKSQISIFTKMSTPPSKERPPSEEDRKGFPYVKHLSIIY